MKIKRIGRFGTALVLTACATVLVATPAFAADANELSISGLSASGASLVPAPRMFSEPADFGSNAAVGPGGELLFPSDGNEYVLLGGPTLGEFELQGRGSHGGYTTTSAKCSVCHSAHSAQVTEPSTGLASATRTNNWLTRRGSTGCEYCHLTGSPVGAAGMSSNLVYHGGVTGGTSEITDLDSGHSLGLNRQIPTSTSDVGTIDMTCATCHVVHGGNFASWMPADFWTGGVTDPITGEDFVDAGQFENNETTDQIGYKLLRKDPGGTGNVPVSIDDLPDEPAIESYQINQYTLGVWCASCHNLLAAEPEPLVPNGDPRELNEFILTDATDVHVGDFATDLEDEPIEGAHPVIWNGAYSGPAQCYTCHRGDLSGSHTAEWDSNGIVPIADAENPQVAELAAFRALGYFALDSGTDAEMRAQQAINLACSSCHFGTADYARVAPDSDWPHRSPDHDIALLGLVGSDGLGGDPEPTRDDLGELFCARCHVDNSDEVPNGFIISQHYITHGQVDNSESGILGFLNSLLSPGYQD
ncbi:MAG: hypothetical protein FWD93_03270 [Coriobacteriia bacterium]|nr:hypothetical protein [Coriobacteriia bacterium]